MKKSLLLIGIMLITFNAFALVNSILPLMPMPQSVIQQSGQYQLSDTLHLSVKGMTEERKALVVRNITEQLAGYHLAVELSEQQQVSGNNVVDKNDVSWLSIVVNQGRKSSYTVPTLKIDESYQLVINSDGIRISAQTDIGALRGLSTLSQLLFANVANNIITLPFVSINDLPRFSWRGFMIDSVRHYISIDAIKRQLRGMAAAKLNVFHWHLTDDQGWRFESKSYPKLTEKASGGLYYTQQEMKDVVAYATLLGIRVVPEIDVPGHASAIAIAYPELLSIQKPYYKEDKWGVFEPLIDPSNDKVYGFIDKIVGELSTIFPDEYVHIGGDEVNPRQWQESTNIQDFMKENDIIDEHDLQVFFNQKIQTILAKYHKKMMGWDEIYHPDLPKNIMVQSWRGLESLTDIASSGYQGLLSTGFYIDQPQASSYHYRNDPLPSGISEPVTLGSNDTVDAWTFTMPRLKGSAISGTLVLVNRNNYVTHAYVKLNNNHFKNASVDRRLTFTRQQVNFSLDTWMGPLRGEFDFSDPTSLAGRILIGNTHYSVSGSKLEHFDVNDVKLLKSIPGQQQQNILGGEATLWTELVSENNIDIRAWPRLFVIAERLWSAKKLTDTKNMYRRLATIDHYATSIGLRHQQQMIDGINGLVFPDTNISSLLSLAEQLEPAQYYTRHHIKYKKGLYHQLAPLRQFVDFIPVESLSIIKMNEHLQDFRKGDKHSLQMVIETMRQWHYNYSDAIDLIKKNPKLSSLTQVVRDARTINTIGLTVAQSCSAGVKISAKQARRAKQLLAELHSKVREISLASGLFVEQLVDACQR